MSSNSRQQISLLLNCVLVITVVGLAFRQSGLALKTLDPKLQLAETPIQVESHFVEPFASPEPEALPKYAEIESPTDRRRLIIDHLRALGVPNEVLGRVAKVDFEVQWDDRFEACHADMKRLAEVQLEMNASKDSEMRAALGEEGFKQWDQDYMLWEAMSTKVEVTPAEAEGLYDLKKKLQRQLFDLDKAQLIGTMDDAEINAATEKAYTEFNEKMRSLLGDERYAKSQQMDEAFMTDNFRYQVSKANPTDAQFRDLLQVQKDWHKARMEIERQYEDNTSSPDYAEKMIALDASRDQAYQSILGSDAFNNLQKSKDEVYTQMKKYENLWGLNDRKIEYVYNTMKEYQKSVVDYQRKVLAAQAQGQNVDWEMVNKNLQNSAEQTQQNLQNYLGSESFDRLQRNRVLRWAAIASRPSQP